MEKKLITLTALLTFSVVVFSQTYITRNGYVRFFSATPIENIEAVNNQASCIVNLETGEVVSKILMEAFYFEKALMQEHFNENYVESDLFPQAILKGKISNLNSININHPEKQEVVLAAELTIHGVTQKKEIKGTLQNSSGGVNASATFMVKPSDFNIKIPKAVANNIAKEIEVTVKFEMQSFKK
jgi:hypothetical protein